MAGTIFEEESVPYTSGRGGGTYSYVRVNRPSKQSI